MSRHKLITMGGLGYVAKMVQVDTVVVLTNPDCVSKIKIDRISIIKEDGVTIYEGSLSHMPHYYSASVGDTLKPHQVVTLLLRRCMPDGSGGWLSEEEALGKPLCNYTVEIFYSVSQKNGLPLIGHAGHLETLPGGYLKCSGIWQIDNMEQVLLPLKEQKPKK